MLVVVLVEPEYEENIGLIARVCKNFGVEELRLVSPKVDYLSDKAISRAMHARELLENAKLFNSLKSAIADCGVVAATSAIVSSGRNISRTAMLAEEFAEKYSCFRGKIAIVFGRESTGLTREEIEECDILVHIPTSEEYKTLNVTHAVAIILYEFFKRKTTSNRYAVSGETKKLLLDAYNSIVFSLAQIRNKKACLLAFKHMLARASLSEREAKTLLAVLAEINRKLNRK